MGKLQVEHILQQFFFILSTEQNYAPVYTK